MSPHGPLHDSVIQRLTAILVPTFASRAAVRIQCAFAAAGDSEPEPDVAVVPAGDYDKAHPSEAWLVIEVAESSLARDRAVKGQLYAESGVAEYWIVNLLAKLIEVHSDIVDGAYTRVTPYGKGAVVRLMRFPDVDIEVDSVLR